MGKKFKNILVYGLVLSLPMILMSVFAYVFDITENKAFGWVSVLVFIISIFFVQRHFRDNFYNGFAPYGKLFGSTLLIIIVSAIMMFAYTFIFYKFIAPEQITRLIDTAKISMYEQEGISSAQINKSIEYMTKYVFTPIAMSLMGFGATIGQGLIISLITTAINKKKKKDGFDAAMDEIGEVEEIQES